MARYDHRYNKQGKIKNHKTRGQCKKMDILRDPLLYVILVYKYNLFKNII